MIWCRRRKSPRSSTAKKPGGWNAPPELEAGNREAMDAGTRRHEGKAAAERIAGGSIAVGRLLVVLAELGLVLVIFDVKVHLVVHAILHS